MKRNIVTMKSYIRNMSVESGSDSEMSCDEAINNIEEVISQAVREAKCMQGVFKCASVLEHSPELVALCILPEEKSQDISAHIQQTLIEAYCWENDIRVANIQEKVLQSIAKVNRKKAHSVTDLTCVLLTTVPCDASITDIDDSDINNSIS
ncbi:growth arrest and DNA damage-inducible protein GADD45 alpha-like [Dreissena polymorpha]|nr:growth arrest and DNA damage-inducible protein GADD45 alpha-like [Dreissena polymorpha]